MNILGSFFSAAIAGLAGILLVMWLLSFFFTLTLVQWCMLAVVIAFVMYVVVTIGRALW